MTTGYYLLDRRNPRAAGGFHGHASRNAEVTCGVLHVAVAAPSTRSAFNVANYLATTDRQVSYHTLVDSDNVVPLLPTEYTAFHVRNFNSPSVGLSFACHTDTWHRYLNWSEKAYALGAPVVAAWQHKHDLPLRLITAAEARRGVRGWTYHQRLDPSRRTDPGAPPFGQFDVEHLFDLASGQEPETPFDPEEMTMLKQGDEGGRVAQLQHLVNRVIAQTGGWPHGTDNAENTNPHLAVDGVFGPVTAERAQHAIWRAERWVLRHPLYAEEDGGSRITGQTEAWLASVSAGLTAGTLEVRP